MKASTLRSLASGAALASLLLTPASQAQYFDPPGSSVDVQQLVQELDTLVGRAERRQRVDPVLLDELRTFIETYEQPWTRTVLSDTFADGNYEQGPSWQVLDGAFQVDSRYGLVARPGARAQSQSGGSRQDLAAAILGSILSQGAQGGGTAPQSEALIQVAAPLANAFAVEADISGVGTGASLLLAVVQGNAGETGYRLLVGDDRVQIERVSQRGSAVVGSASRSTRADARGNRTLRWTRGRNGRMRVQVNEQTLLEAVDRGLRDGFARVLVGARGAEVGIRRIEAATLP